MGRTPELDTLKSVIAKTATLMEGVHPDQLSAPTPCPEWDVQRLTGHLIGWAEYFADRAEGTTPADNPDSVPLGDDPAGQFRTAGNRIVTGLSADGELPEKAPPPGMLIAEYVVHGTDLATATGQPPPYTDDEAAPGLGAMREMLTPEYRGQAFDDEVDVPEDARTITKLLAFSGRAV